MIDVVTVGAGGGSIAWISPEGTLKVGPQSAGADPGPMCYRAGGSDPTITDAHAVLGRIPPHLLGGEVPLDVDLAAQGIRDLAGKLGLGFEACATGVLEISAWNQANALRQVTVNRGLDVRDFTMVTFGGSGSLLACRLVDILGLEGVLVPLNPGNLSAYGLLTVDVRNDYVQTAVARQSHLDRGARADGLRRPRPAGRRRARARGLPRRAAPVRTHRRPALLRPGLRGPGRGARGADHRRAARHRRRPVPRRAQGALRLRLPRRPAPGGRVGQPPGHRHRPDPQARGPRGRARHRCGDRPHRDPAGLLRRLGGHPGLRPRPARRRRRRRGAGGVRGVQLDRAAAPRLHAPGSTRSAT